MSIAKLLDKTARVIPAGGVVPGVVVNVPCTIAPADPATVIAYAQQGITCVNLIYTTANLGAAVGDQVAIAGKTYPVVAIGSFNNARIGPTIYVTACGAGT